MRSVPYIVLNTIVLLTLLTLTGCAYKRTPYLNSDLTKETWQHDVHTSPNGWAKKADRWFLTGDPNATEEQDSAASYSQATTTMMVRVPNTFTNIKAQGVFQVQIFGSYDCNSVYVYGPNKEVRETEIKVVGDTLYLRQSPDATHNMDKVIIRVGIMNLHNLVQAGPGSIEGRVVRSDELNILSQGQGNIYLSGGVNLRRVNAMDKGSINVFGAISPYLVVKSSGSGCINLSGNLGVKNIQHHGRGDINLIGVNSRALKIYADGRGKIGLNGRFNVNEITAKDSTAVFGYNVQSDSLYVYTFDQARVGLAGYVNNLTVNSANGSRFEGRNLHAFDAYVRASDSAHINVTATNKIFAAATQNSSVYFYGSPKLLSQFVSGNGLVIPVWGSERPAGFSSYRTYKDSAPSYAPPSHAKRRWAANYKGY